MEEVGLQIKNIRYYKSQPSLCANIDVASSEEKIGGRQCHIKDQLRWVS